MARRPVPHVSGLRRVARVDADGGYCCFACGGVDAALVSNSFMLQVRGGAAAATREPVPADAGLIADLVARACTGGCAKACGILADKARGGPKGDDDNLEDLCMGTQRTYNEKLQPGEFELVGVNCGGDSFVEGDVLFTMYPKYELAY